MRRERKRAKSHVKCSHTHAIYQLTLSFFAVTAKAARYNNESSTNQNKEKLFSILPRRRTRSPKSRDVTEGILYLANYADSLRFINIFCCSLIFTKSSPLQFEIARGFLSISLALNVYHSHLRRTRKGNEPKSAPNPSLLNRDYCT